MRLLEAALSVSEYTDKIDTIGYGLSKAKRIVHQIRELCSILSGLMLAADYKKGQELFEDRTRRDRCVTRCRREGIYSWEQSKELLDLIQFDSLFENRDPLLDHVHIDITRRGDVIFRQCAQAVDRNRAIEVGVKFSLGKSREEVAL